jgi:hypothetical protein
MRYLAWLATSALLAGPLLVGAALLLAPAPITAEYWVREALTVKREIARRHAGTPRILVLSGSSGIFGIDTTAMTTALGRPAINLSTHANLPLDDVLGEIRGMYARGDVVVLPLEPARYCGIDAGPWYPRNRIAWMPAAWSASPLAQRIENLWRLGPAAWGEIAYARAASLAAPGLIAARLAAIDDAGVLRRFATRTPPTHFRYSAMHLDDLGNMLRTESAATYAGPPGVAPDLQIPVCDGHRETLRRFVAESAAQGVAVYLANAPFMSTRPLEPAAIDRAAAALESELVKIAPLLDTRRDATFGREYFFDSAEHLNAEGRRIRTERLVAALRPRL